MILIVEDNVLIAMVIQDDLDRAGYDVVGPAATNRAALDLVEQHEISLALVDIDLAEGDSGLDLARELSAKHSIPCLFVTGQTPDAISNAAAALGVLRKPFDGRQLLETVETALAIAHEAAPVPEVEDESIPVTWFHASGAGSGANPTAAAESGI